LQNNCDCHFSVKINKEKDETRSDTYFQIISFDIKHNHSKNYGFKVKITDEIEEYVKKNFDPKKYGPTALQSTLFKQFQQKFSISQANYLLHRLFHKGVKDIQNLVAEVLLKNPRINYKIGLDDVNQTITFFNKH